jgi:uncharacterized membrane protein YuzA (DUF378 family)
MFDPTGSQVYGQYLDNYGKDVMRALNVLALTLVIVGAFNWLLVGLFEYDLVAEIVGEGFGNTNLASRIIYVAVGVAGIFLAVTLLPSLLRDGNGYRSHERTTVSTR